MSDLVRSPEDIVSHDMTQIKSQRLARALILEKELNATQDMFTMDKKDNDQTAQSDLHLHFVHILKQDFLLKWLI